jgi:hypothetical protein
VTVIRFLLLTLVAISLTAVVVGIFREIDIILDYTSHPESKENENQ